MSSLIHQIAEEAGVSISTVSRVLHGDTSYNRPFYAERAQRIRAIAERLNYQPNLAARAISTGRFGAIALIAASSGYGGLPPHLVDGIAESATEHEWTLSIARLSPEDFSENKKLPSILNSSAADGLLINYTHAWPSGLHELIKKQGKPAVWLNIKEKTNCVHFADRDAARTITQAFIERGHKRIVYIDSQAKNNKHTHYSQKDRLAGYKAAMKKAGLEELILHMPNTENLIEDSDLQSLMSSSKHPSAVVANGFAEAVCACAISNGLRIPDDCCIASFNRMSSSPAGLPIVSLQIPQNQLGRAGVLMLERLINGKRKNLPAQEIPIPIHRQHLMVGPNT